MKMEKQVLKRVQRILQKRKIMNFQVIQKRFQKIKALTVEIQKYQNKKNFQKNQSF